MSYALSIATPEDANELAQLAAITYRDTWQPLYTKDVMENYLAKAFAPQAVALSLQDPAYRYWVMRTQNKIVAYAKAGPLSLPTPPPHDACIELQRLYVLPAHQRKGLGQQLFTAFEAHVRERQFRSAFVTVWSNNAPALALYYAAGFHEVGQFHMPLGDFTNYDIDPDLILRKDYIR